MKPRRFHLDGPVVPGSTVTVDGALFRHMATVLRLKAGAPLVLIDPHGGEYSGEIVTVGEGVLTVAVGAVADTGASTSGLKITLLQGLPKGEKMELIVQKVTELGAAGIVPTLCTRSVSRPDGERREAKVRRWQKIAVEAARQSERGVSPEIGAVTDFAAAVAAATGVKLMLWEEENECCLRDALPEHAEEVTLLVGPEGGLTAEEAATARAHGFLSVRLGPRILRTETAAVAGVAVLQFALGDLG